MPKNSKIAIFVLIYLLTYHIAIVISRSTVVRSRGSFVFWGVKVWYQLFCDDNTSALSYSCSHSNKLCVTEGCHVIRYDMMLCHFTSYHIMLCHIMRCYFNSSNTILYPLSYMMNSHVSNMLCYAVLYS